MQSSWVTNKTVGCLIQETIKLGGPNCCAPPKVSVFGIIDHPSHPGGTTQACIHTKAKGGKGAGDVASLVMKFLNDEGRLKEEE